MPTPHRVVHGLADGLAHGAEAVVSTVTGGLKSAGGAVMGAADKPLRDLSGLEGPHRIVDRALNGAVGAGQKFVNQGVLGSAETAGEGLMHALDQPVEQFGVPPDLGTHKLGLPKPPKFEGPRMGRMGR